jgi:hypothetical protein
MTIPQRCSNFFLFWTAFALLTTLAGGASAQTMLSASPVTINPTGVRPHAQTLAFTPIRPPSVPLITRSPYVSTWLNGDTAPATWPGFWTGTIKAITGMASIDGSAYLFMGAPGGIPPTTAMTQTQLQVTPTQSIYTFTGGGVTLTVDFLSPIEATDLKRLSIPLGDIIATAQSSDGRTHTVRLYFDISGEWAHGSTSAPIDWRPETVSRSADGSATAGSLMTWEVTPDQPSVLTETSDYPDWGVALLATGVQSNLTSQSGQDTVVRGQFVSNGVLLNTNDTNQPRAVSTNWPVFAYCLNLGTVSSTPTTPFTLLLGHVRDPAVSYQGQNIPSLWKSYFGTYETMLAFALNDAPAALSRANTLDTQITTAATQAGGAHYAALCSLALRQAFAGTELIDPTMSTPSLGATEPWLFLKEISSDGNVSTVDVVYPAFPAFLYANPELVRLLLDPLIAYAESGKWPELFAEHDLGSSYPNASGHNDGGGENMPVEETANMLIMADAYTRATPLTSSAVAYAQAHYPLFRQWANYLLTVPSGVAFPNALDPQYQNQTDDFTGQIAHSVNLSLKGIIAVGAMGQIAALTGNSTDAAYYSTQAKTLIGQWVQKSQNAESSHLLLQYMEPANAYSPATTSEPDTAWSLKYNAFPDRLLGTNLIPQSVLTEEATFYKTQEQAYGIPLDYRNPYTKTDWEMWTAASTGDATLRQNIIDEIYGFANTTGNRVPFTDWYYPITAEQAGFQARPVIGGIFAPLVVVSVSGTVSLQNVSAGNMAQPLTFTFTPTGTTAGGVLTQTLTPAADGTFTLTGIAPGTYILGVKGSKWLRKDVSVDTTAGAVTGLNVSLLGGDANGDNQVTALDLLAVKNAYNSVLGSPNYNAAADFNCDGQVTALDLLIVKLNYNKTGDP